MDTLNVTIEVLEDSVFNAWFTLGELGLFLGFLLVALWIAYSEGGRK